MKKTLLVMANGLKQTNTQPEPFEAFGPKGEFLVEYSIFDAIEAGFTKIVFVIQAQFAKEFKKIMRPKLDRIVQVEFACQGTNILTTFLKTWYKKEKAWDELHAPWAARKIIKEPFLVINANNYYGKHAYKAAHEFLEQNTRDFAVLGYPLGQTLSNYGGVDRGVCIQKGSSTKLDNIIVIKGVRKDYADRVDFRSPKGVIKGLTTEDMVSTNMFCLTPKFYDFAENTLLNFDKTARDDQTKELMISDVINNGLGNKEVNGHILDANSNWLGVAYKADRIMARYRIEDKIKRGLYPNQLFA